MAQANPSGGSTALHYSHNTDPTPAACVPCLVADAIVLSEPLAEYVLVATQDYLRLYTVEHAVAADRTTCKRVSLPGVLQFASSFAAQGAPALVCLLQLEGEVHLQVKPYTLNTNKYGCCGPMKHSGTNAH